MSPLASSSAHIHAVGLALPQGWGCWLDLALQRAWIAGREASSLASPYSTCPLTHSRWWHREDGILCHHPTDLKSAPRLWVACGCCSRTDIYACHFWRYWLCLMRRLLAWWLIKGPLLRGEWVIDEIKPHCFSWRSKNFRRANLISYLFICFSKTGLHFHPCRLILLIQNCSFSRKVNSSLSYTSLPRFLGKRDL